MGPSSELGSSHPSDSPTHIGWPTEQRFPSTPSLFHYGCGFCVRRRCSTSLYHPSESATEPLHVPSLSFLNRDLRRLGTNHGIPLVGGPSAGQIERVQECVCTSFRPCRLAAEVLTAPTGISRQPWMIVSQTSQPNGQPSPDGANIQTLWSAQWQDPETTAKPKPISIPKGHLRPPVQFPTSITSDPPTPT